MRDHDLMQGDEFLKKIATQVKCNQPAGLGEIDATPPWSTDSESIENLGTAHAQLCSRIDMYIRRASLVKFEDGSDVLDPLMVGLLLKSIKPELEYLSAVADVGDHEGMAWIAKQLRQAQSVLERES